MNKECGYLTEQLLGDCLNTMYGSDYIISQFPIKIGNKKYRIDYNVSLNDRSYWFEFDGFRHYNSRNVILRDNEVDSYAKENGITLIRLPYFFQMSIGLLKDHIPLPEWIIDGDQFSKEFKSKVPNLNFDFPFGFISKKALRPYDFNKMGFIKYQNDLAMLLRLGLVKEHKSIIDTEES